MQCRHLAFLLTTILMGLALPSLTFADDTAFVLNGPAGFGWHVAFLGDLNHDGFRDILISANQDAWTGALYLYSGKDGTLLFSELGTHPAQDLGLGIGPTGDVNADHVPDFAAADDTLLYVFSGSTFTKLYAFQKPQPDMESSNAIDTLGDVDGDGHDDFVLGCFGYSEGPYHAYRHGRVDLYSGATGAVIWSVVGPQGSNFGLDLSPIRDIDGDGVQDLIVGAERQPSSDWPGAVDVYSGQSGTLLHRIFDPTGGSSTQFGYCVSSIRDLDNDGIDDILASDPQLGSVYAFSGATGALLYGIRGVGLGFGIDLASVGDINGDTVEDFSVGQDGDNSVRCYSGKTATLLETIHGHTDEALGGSIWGGVSRSDHVGYAVISAPPYRAYVLNWDLDEDGLFNYWEEHGVPVGPAGATFYALPRADSRHKDLYVETDAMSGMAPSAEALHDVVTAFANSPVSNPDGTTGVSLHIVGAPSCDWCVDEANLPLEDWPDAWPGFDADKATHFGTQLERLRPNWSDIRAAKARAYRYCIFGHTFGGTTNSGLAEIGGNDFMVTFGGWGAVTTQEQAGTFMHELGHTLGFRHGGSDDWNCKPNYHSVMNYTWQVPVRDLWHLPNYLLFHNSWRLDYSRDNLPPLSENSLLEPDVLGGHEATWVPVGPPCDLSTQFPQLVNMEDPVDWNRNLAIDTAPVCADANWLLGIGGCGPSRGQDLAGQSDWELLHLLRRTPDWEDLGPRQREDVEEMSFDDLIALSSLRFDCNGNGIPDDEEIANGTLQDLNGNGIPDVCEQTDQSGVNHEESSEPPNSNPMLRITPNPSNGQQRVEFLLRADESIRLRVLDAAGREIAVLANGPFGSGPHAVIWKQRDGSGHTVASGVYYLDLSTGEGKLRKPIVVVR